MQQPVDHLRVAGQVRGWVGERRVPGEAAPEGSGGRFTSENAGMSSDTHVRNVCAD